MDEKRTEQLWAADHEERKGDAMALGSGALDALEFPTVQSCGHDDHILDIVAPG